jgi:hypothetical protein
VLIPGEAVDVKSAAEALMRAVRVKNAHAGVVAYSRTTGANHARHRDDVEIIARYGAFPSEEALQD